MKILNHKLLSKYIRRTDLSISDLAKQMQMSRVTIHNIWSGQSNPSYSLMEKLAYEMYFTPQDFVDIFFPTIPFAEEFSDEEYTKQLELRSRNDY